MSSRFRWSVLAFAIFSALVFAGNSYGSSIDDTLKSLNQNAVSNAGGSGAPAGGIVSNCTALNVRSGPGTDHPVIGGLTAGAAISIISEENGWWKIKYNGGTGYVSGKYIDTKAASSSASSGESFTGHVEVDSRLNVRSGPWGDITGKLNDGDKVEVVGKVGEWYKIKQNGKISYVFASYIKKGASSSSTAASNKSPDNDSSSAAGGSTQAKIVACAEKYIGSTKFRGPEVSGGNLACAQFVSTALKDAGVLSHVDLGVLGVMADLKAKGWKVVSAPPFKAGDVITWKTYDRNHDGAKDEDTHIGIIDGKGQAISNSSSLKMPRRNGIYYAPVSHVLRQS
ncbi:MAG TPA: SH3 domain-containing protein [Candidatus Wallbacteria bacterium]|nr:SH3 domain-containing protein [Candidatus Wallbacteria bacterium]